MDVKIPCANHERLFGGGPSAIHFVRGRNGRLWPECVRCALRTTMARNLVPLEEAADEWLVQGVMES